MTDICEAIAEGLAQELKPPDGYVIHVRRVLRTDNTPKWIVRILHAFRAETCVAITLHLESEHIRAYHWSKHASFFFEYEDQQLIEKIQEYLRRLC